MKKRRLAGCTMMFIAILSSGAVMAQLDQAVPGKDLLEPWSRTKTVVVSLAQSFENSMEPDQRSRLDSTLSKLEDELSKLQSQQETNVCVPFSPLPPGCLRLRNRGELVEDLP
jgi:hypothetical protein